MIQGISFNTLYHNIFITHLLFKNFWLYLTDKTYCLRCPNASKGYPLRFLCMNTQSPLGNVFTLLELSITYFFNFSTFFRKKISKIRKNVVCTHHLLNNSPTWMHNNLALSLKAFCKCFDNAVAFHLP